MFLADETRTPIPPGIALLSCHVAVWYWARRLAEDRGLVIGVQTPRDLLMRIGSMTGAGQPAMLALPRSGQWDLTAKAQPPVNTVLLWTAGATHSAVVTGDGQITGYNQGFIYGQTPASVLSTITSAQVLPAFKLCYTISETTILKAAAAGQFGQYPRG
jgi:hypothetical protein